jgi:hypothetical protein
METFIKSHYQQELEKRRTAIGNPASDKHSKRKDPRMGMKSIASVDNGNNPRLLQVRKTRRMSNLLEQPEIPGKPYIIAAHSEL